LNNSSKKPGNKPDAVGKGAMPAARKYLLRGFVFLVVLLLGPMLVVSCGNIRLGQDWRTADRSPTGIAPDPSLTQEAVIQVYAARAFNWRGMFAVHTWIATKPENANGYSVHQVVGWRQFRGLPALVSAQDIPDRSWFGSQPQVIADIRGEKAEALISRIHAAVASYPYSERYTTWPGPNSNTFVAYVARQVPELRLELPTTAIGKDYLSNGSWAARAPSGTGYQLSLFGLMGITAAAREGLELNLLGLAFGVDPEDLAIKLPGVGNVGFR
jgi:hypothetical protein